MVGSIIMITSVWLRDHHHLYRLVMNAIIIIKVTVHVEGWEGNGEEEEGVKEEEVERKKADHRRPCAVPLY